MKWLTLLLLTQNINVTPIETRQNGVRVPQRVVQRQYVIDCRTNMTCAVDAGILFLSAASGGGGSSNFVNDAVTFAGGHDATKTVTAAWATGASSIVCAPLDEEGSVERLQLVVTSRAAGSFVVRASLNQGRHTGALNFTCTGN